MLVIGCCAINRLSVSCQVFSAVECLIIKTVEKTFKTSRYFPCCLFSIACGCCSDIVPVGGWRGRVLRQAGPRMGLYVALRPCELLFFLIITFKHTAGHSAWRLQRRGCVYRRESLRVYLCSRARGPA